MSRSQTGPQWWGTLLFVPLVLAAAWLLTRPLLLLGLDGTDLGVVVMVVALLLLIVCLPWRLRRVWGSTAPLRQLGLAEPLRQSLPMYGHGLLAAAALLVGLTVVLLLLKQVQWSGATSGPLLLNAVALLGVGFAEELLFRGWLWGELRLQLSPTRALHGQALVFSLAHVSGVANVPADQRPAFLLGLLPGLYVLGLVLAIQRRRDGGSLAGAVAFHGGLVAGWFLLQSGLITFADPIPLWMLGPGGRNANPLGGLLGWIGVLHRLWTQRRWIKEQGIP